MDPTQDIVTLVENKAWIPLAAIVIGLVVRLTKSDRFAAWFPINVPPQYRAALALALGAVAGVISEFAKSGNWKSAIVGALLAGLMPIAAHDIVVEGVRKGRDIGEPKRPPPLPLLAPEDLDE
jgi:hypothetical protein